MTGVEDVVEAVEVGLLLGPLKAGIGWMTMLIFLGAVPSGLVASELEDVEGAAATGF